MPTPIPPPPGFDQMTLTPPPARWDSALGEYLLDWDDVRAGADPHGAGSEFARSAFRHACVVCGWDDALAAAPEGQPPADCLNSPTAGITPAGCRMRS